MGANVFRRPQTRRDVARFFAQVRSPRFDSVRRWQTPWNSLTRKRSLVQIQYGPRIVTWPFLFLARPFSALRPYNWPYSECYRWAKTCPGHRTAACGRSSPRAGHSPHSAGSAREGALPLPGSGEVFARELADGLGLGYTGLAVGSGVRADRWVLGVKQESTMAQGSRNGRSRSEMKTASIPTVRTPSRGPRSRKLQLDQSAVGLSAACQGLQGEVEGGGGDGGQAAGVQVG